jgi:hypothetical protein
VAIVVWMAVVGLLLAAAGARWLRARLPEAPRCPRCSWMTVVDSAPALHGQLWGLLTSGAHRRCGRCGWAGRMRWRPALERAVSNR